MSDETVVAPPEDKPDRREALAAALDAAEAAPTPEAVVEGAPVVDERRRDEKGQFLPAEPVVEGAVAETPPEPVEEPVWKRPPASWRKDRHELWATAASDPKLAPLVEYAFQREEEMKRGIEDIIPKAKFADQVNLAMEPFRENIKASGVEPVQALQSLMVADHQLRSLPVEQKAAYGLGLLAQYGVPIEAIYNALANPQPQIPPGYVPVQNVQNIVRNEISGWEQSQQDARLAAEIEVFRADKPDFDDLKPAMSALLEKGIAPDLASAYEKAKRLDDGAFAKMQEGLQAQAIADRAAAADKAAKAARAAAVSVRSSTPGARPATNAKDRRSVIAEQLDSLNERF